MLSLQLIFGLPFFPLRLVFHSLDTTVLFYLSSPYNLSITVWLTSLPVLSATENYMFLDRIKWLDLVFFKKLRKRLLRFEPEDLVK